MPFYFQFLTLLAFHVFLQEKVDLAVVEVGIGGQYDCTNIISLLGDTMEKITWQKAGIFKPGVPAFTVRQQPNSLRVLQCRAKDVRCPLRVCPELDQYEVVVGPVNLGLAGKHQRLNASFALQLSHSWLQRHKAEEGTGHHSSTVCVQHMLAHCRKNQSSWQSLNATETIYNHHRHPVTSSLSHSLVFPCILSTLQWIS
ncbi:folylpolyglutamate synthase, mitochondrial-like protein [Lates japonicus]|uniref:Folylpolyglutamate synthase, mitochondrial-like protein n=1 Tax=Lates japonicus TaxID=270547 RepID=A0AAD3MF81_LATJO|nr:folylpolyglutamate synthase, mitochondrial-like protein [Lates japonicus]